MLFIFIELRYLNLVKAALSIIFILFTFTSGIIAQKEKVISTKKLNKDFNQIIEFLEAHPSLFHQTAEEKFNNHINKIKHELKEDLSVEDFFKLTAPLISNIKDGHTSLRLPLDWLRQKRRKNGIFPYRIHINDHNELYLLNHIEGNQEIAQGTKVIIINGILVDSIFKTIDPWISYEKVDFRNALIEDNFETYLFLFFGDYTTLEITYLEDKVRTSIVTNLAFKQWKNTKKERRLEREKLLAKGHPYLYTKISNDIGLLNIYSFAVPNI